MDEKQEIIISDLKPDSHFELNPIAKNLARLMIKTLGPEKISEMVSSIFVEAIKGKQNIELLNDETDIIGIIYDYSGTATFATVAIRENEAGNSEITRYLSVSPILTIVKNLLSNI